MNNFNEIGDPESIELEPKDFEALYQNREDPWWQSNFKQQRIDELRSILFGNVLDLGCGEYDLFPYIQNKMSLDISHTALLRHPSTLPKIQSDMSNLPFRNESFDIVTSIENIYYVNNPLKVVLEIHRVLRNGGLFIVGFPESKMPLGLFHHLIYGMFRIVRMQKTKQDHHIILLVRCPKRKLHIQYV